MVPMDQPKVGLTLIQTFLQDRRFGKAQSKLGVALTGPQEEGASSLTQCPRFLEAAPNSSALASSHVATQAGGGDSFINKLSLWAGGPGGGGKRKSGGNLRKSRGTQMSGGNSDGRRVHTVSRSESAEKRILTTKRAMQSEGLSQPDTTNYCPFATSTAGSCCASVVWSVRSPSGGGWASADGLQTERASNLAAAVLQADFDDAVRGSLTPPASSSSSSFSHPSSSVESGASVTVRLGQPHRSSEDIAVLAVLEQADPMESPAAVVLVTTEVCGPAADVRTRISMLLAQAKDNASPLLSGLLTRHLDPRPTAVISHNRPPPDRFVQ